MRTKRMVPISRNELKSPRSRKAIECRGISVRNAPTVVILPIIRGIEISLRAVRMDVVCDRWAIR